MDLEQGMKSTRNPMPICAVSFLIGIISVALVYGMSQYIAGAIVGAVGLVLGGYAVNLGRHDKNNAMVLMIISAIGLFTSMIGFIVGFASAL